MLPRHSEVSGVPVVESGPLFVLLYHECHQVGCNDSLLLLKMRCVAVFCAVNNCEKYQFCSGLDRSSCCEIAASIRACSIIAERPLCPPNTGATTFNGFATESTESAKACREADFPEQMQKAVCVNWMRMGRIALFQD